MKKILIAIGTRPEAIKMAPIILEIRKFYECKVCVTAQHRKLLDQVLEIFNIKPDFDLNIMKSNQNLFDVSTKVLSGMNRVFKKFKPDLLLVHGDTTTSTMAALAGFYEKISIGHVEAGLRTNDIFNPYPEEMNRQLTARIANYHFAPTLQSKKKLLKEGIQSENIFVTGNTSIDAIFLSLDKTKSITKKLKIPNIEGLKIITVTAHRRENFGKPLENICNAILDILKKYTNLVFVFPVHPNPNVQNFVYRLLGGKNRIILTEPLDYLTFIGLMQKSYLILTDSGGIQEEAPSLDIPVLVLRSSTERIEAEKAGTIKLIGTEKNNIIKNVSKLLLSTIDYSNMTKSVNPYGDGLARKKISSIIKNL